MASYNFIIILWSLCGIIIGYGDSFSKRKTILLFEIITIGVNS